LVGIPDGLGGRNDIEVKRHRTTDGPSNSDGPGKLSGTTDEKDVD